MSESPTAPAVTDLIALAARFATAGANLLTGATGTQQGVCWLADKYLHMSRELLEYAEIDNPYLHHSQVTVWNTATWCYKRLAYDDLTPAQHDEYAALTESWNALLDQSEGVQS